MSHFHVKRNKIDHVFISHLHGDHYFGLIGLITSYHLMGRKKPLTIFGPAGLEKIVALQLELGGGFLQYELRFVTTWDDVKREILNTGKIKVFSFPMKHRIPTTGFLFEEVEGPRVKQGRRVRDAAKSLADRCKKEQADPLFHRR